MAAHSPVPTPAGALAVKAGAWSALAGTTGIASMLSGTTFAGYLLGICTISAGQSVRRWRQHSKAKQEPASY